MNKGEIKTKQGRGRPPMPEEKQKKPYQLRVDRQLLDEAKEAALLYNTTVTRLIEEGLRFAIAMGNAILTDSRS